MATLRRPPSRLSPAPARIVRAGEMAAPAPVANPLRPLYSTARWRRLRWAVLVRDLFTCQMCGRLEGNTALLVADHAKPHRGREALFWDADNIRCVCKPCHDGEKQRQEQASRHTAGVWD